MALLVAPSLESDEMAADLSTLDLSMVRMKLMDLEEGEGWSEVYVDRVEAEYRRYLALARFYSSAPVVPSRTVDKFWHYHILDTRAYADDCETVFGYFLHHFPYFGMRGEEDAAALACAYDDTIELYKLHFGDPPADLWPQQGMSRCPNCGRR